MGKLAAVGCGVFMPCKRSLLLLRIFPSAYINSTHLEITMSTPCPSGHK